MNLMKNNKVIMNYQKTKKFQNQMNKDEMQQMPNDLRETVKGFDHDHDGNKVSVQSESN
ncbi:hypothetical protein Tco_0460041, partial [Tanacetum coccineum]